MILEESGKAQKFYKGTNRDLKNQNLAYHLMSLSLAMTKLQDHAAALNYATELIQLMDAL